MRTRAILTAAILLAASMLPSPSLGPDRASTAYGQNVNSGAKASGRLAAASVPVTIYDPDPEHLWNRLHKALWVRTGPDGNEYGHDRLDPLLWMETRHLVEGRS